MARPNIWKALLFAVCIATIAYFSFLQDTHHTIGQLEPTEEPFDPFSSCPADYKLDLCHSAAYPNLTRMSQSEYHIPMCVNEDKFTVVILTHGKSRVPLMLKCLQNFSQMKKIHKIIILWSNQGFEPPDITKTDKPCVVVHVADSLRLRFQPLPEIETQAVFSVDDDLIIDEEDLYTAFDVWKKHAYGIVGFQDNRRSHSPEKSEDNNYKYIMNPHSYSMILTSAAFIHKEYLRLFTETLPKEMKNFIDSEFNCEDIAMNMMISNHTNSAAALHIREQIPIRHIASLAKPGLGSRKNHGKDRSACIGKFGSQFTELPLKKTSCVY